MDSTDPFHGTNPSFSPSGQLLATITTTHLRIHSTLTPTRHTDLRIRSPPKEISSLKWSPDETLICISTPSLIEIVDLDDERHRIRLDNGSAGLGRFASADFIGQGSAHLLVQWEFGRAKIWDLATGKGTELGDLKTRCEFRSWAVRPASTEGPLTLALLSRPNAQDCLTLFFPATGHAIGPTPMATQDARGLQWSPDGRWLAIPDTPLARPSLHILTPDGHKFRSYPPTTANAADDEDEADLGLKSLTWSPDSTLLALARHDATVTLLNTRTFSPLASIRHDTTIALPQDPDVSVPIHQERVSPSLTRSYASPTTPLTLPLSYPATKTPTNPSDLGIVDVRFSSSSQFLATWDSRCQSTVWVWDTRTLRPHAVVIQHANVRRLVWAPRRNVLVLDCGEGVAYFFDATAPEEAPTPVAVTLPAVPTFAFAPTPSHSLPTGGQNGKGNNSAVKEEKSVLLASTKTTFVLLYPFGRTSNPTPSSAHPTYSSVGAAEDGEEEEDSLLEVLTGRKAVTRPEDFDGVLDVDGVMEEEGEEGERLEDTFREKSRVVDGGGGGVGGGNGAGNEWDDGEREKDPLDDSEIF